MAVNLAELRDKYLRTPERPEADPQTEKDLGPTMRQRTCGRLGGLESKVAEPIQLIPDRQGPEADYKTRDLRPTTWPGEQSR